MVSFTLSFICNYPGRRTYPSRNAGMQYFPAQITLRGGGLGERAILDSGCAEKLGVDTGKGVDREDPGGETIWGGGGWPTPLGGKDFPASLDYFSRDGRERR